MPEDLVVFRHVLLLFPVQSSFSDDVDEADEEEADKHQHGQKSIPAQSTEIHRIGIEENYFHVKQHKQDRYKKIFNGHWLTGIPELLDATFKHLKLVAGLSFRTKQAASEDHNGNQTNSKNQLNSDREIITCPADFRDLTNGIRLQ